MQDAYKYLERSDCFVRMHSKYGSDGAETLGENIADNVGLQLSYRAFKHSIAKDLSPLLYSSGSVKERKFFTSYAQVKQAASRNVKIFGVSILLFLLLWDTTQKYCLQNRSDPTTFNTKVQQLRERHKQTLL